MAESSGVVEVAVRAFPNRGRVPKVGTPFGLRVTSGDGSALGETWLKPRCIPPCSVSLLTAGEDYSEVFVTVYFRPDHDLYAVVRISISNDSLREGEERFTVQLKSFDISVILANSMAEVVILDDDGI